MTKIRRVYCKHYVGGSLVKTWVNEGGRSVDAYFQRCGVAMWVRVK